MATVRWIVDTATTPGTWEEYDAVYSGLEVAMADAYDLVTATESLTIDCTSGADSNADTTAVTVDGWTTSVDYTLTIQAHKNDQHGGVWDDLIYRLEATASNAGLIALNNNYVTIKCIQGKDTETGQTACHGLAYGYNIYYTLDRCIFTSDATAANIERGNGVYIHSSHIKVKNCIFFNLTHSGIYINYTSADTIILENNICYNCSEYGMAEDTTNSYEVSGNICISNALGDYSQTNPTGDHNVSSDTSAPGTNTVKSFDYSTLFPNASSGDFRPSISYVSALGVAWGAGAIPWERSVEVNTDTGGDYTSLATAEAGEQTIGDDLVLRNEKMVISCTSGGTTTADTTAVTIDANWTTSESCDFTIQAHENDRHGGVWDDSKYNLNLGNSYYTGGLALRSQYIVVFNIQMTGADDYRHLLYVGADTLNVVADLNALFLVALDNGETEETTGVYNPYTADIIIRNSIVSGFTNNFELSNGTFTANNCTSFNALSGGFENISHTTNCISINSTLDFNSSGGSNNISSDATATGAGSIANVTVYDATTDVLPVVPETCVIFKDIVNNDFRLVSHKVENYKGEMVETNSAIGNGTYLYDVEDDCAGKSRQPYQFKGTRTQRSFDIGAWQAPVQLTYMVDTDGVSGDYSSLATGFAGLQADTTDLVTDNMLPTISCQASTGVADTSPVNFSGVSNSDDTVLNIVGDYAGHGVWKDEVYTRSMSGTSSGESCFYFNIAFIAFKNIQCEVTDDTDGTTYTGLFVSYAGVTSNVTIQDTLSFFRYDIGTGMQLSAIASDSHINITRNIIYNADYAISDNHKYDAVKRSGVIANNTVINNNNGIYARYNSGNSSVEVNNNISIESTNESFNFSNVTSSNNISSDSTGDITGLSGTYFTDPTNGDFTPVASAGQLTAYSASANATETVGAIPFIDEKVVDTGGTGDYTSLATWGAAAQNFCVAGETARANCEASTSLADTTAVTIAGFDAGVFVEVIGDNDSGIWDSSKYSIETYDHHSIIVYNEDGYISNLQLKLTCTDSTGEPVALYCGYNDPRGCDRLLAENLIISVNNNYTVDNWGYAIRNYRPVTLRNISCISEGTRIASYGAICNAEALLHNMTVSGNFNHGIRSYNDYVVTAVNCVINTPNGSDFYELFNQNSSNNVSSDGTADSMTGANNCVINQDFTGDFVSATDLHTTDSPYELWGADGAYAGAFGDGPYEIEVDVDLGGTGDYTGLGSALSSNRSSRRDLVLRNEKHTYMCRDSVGTNSDSSIDIDSAWSTDDTRFISILGVEALGNTFNTALYYINNSSTSAIRSETYRILVKDIQILMGGGGGGSTGIYITQSNAQDVDHSASEDINNTNVLIDSVIVKCTDSESTGIQASGGARKTVVRNALIYKPYSTAQGSGDEGISCGGVNTYLTADNCTVFNFNDGVERDNGNLLVRNSIVFGNNDDFDIPGGSIVDYCMSDDGDGTNVITAPADWNDVFIDYQNGDFTLKEGSNAIGAGVDLSADFTDDITGATREVPWDIGAFKYVDLGGDVTLILTDGQHDHLADSLDLLQLHILGLVDSYHSHGADGLTLLQQHLLSVVDAAQAHVADNLILEQLHNLTVAGAEHAHTANNLTLIQQHLLSLFGATHDHTADDLNLIQQHLLAVFDTAHAHFVDELILLQGQLLEIAESDHAHSADSLDIIQQHLLSLFDATHEQTASILALLQQHLLSTFSADHAHTADNLSVVQQHLLALADSDHAHIADSLDIIQQHLLTLSDTQHDHTADSLDIIQLHLLTILGTEHHHTAEELELIQGQFLAILDALHSQDADAVDLLQQHLLSLADSDHEHTADAVDLIQQHLLALAGTQHGHTAENLTLLIGTIFLAINNTLHSQTAEGLTLQQQHLLAIAEAYHAHSAEEPSLTMALLLAIADALHSQGAEGVTLTQNHLLAAEDAMHALFSDVIDLNQIHNVNIEDALHSLLTDNLALLQEHNIDIGDSLHTHTSDNIILFLQGMGLGVVIDAGVIRLTPQRGKLVLTLDRSAKTLTVDTSAISV